MKINPLKLKLFFALIVASLNFAYSQKAYSPFARTYIDTLPKRFELDVTELRNYIYEAIPDDLRHEKYPRKTYRYADLSSIQTSNLFSSGLIYSDWPAFEGYLNKILEEVVPDELKGEKYLQAYLVKNGEFNAYMTPSGMMFINIGVFAEIENEATLAGIIAHELAHYYLKHSINTYVKSERGDFKPRVFYKNKDAYSKFSIKSELEADSLAYQWVAASGYSTNGLIQAFKISERQEKKTLAKYWDLWELTETTHPASERRLARIEAYMKEHPDTTGKDFLFSKNGFVEFRKQAKPEILKYLLIDFDYLKCIEKAFIFHLYDIENPVYVYYLMEAIRRAGYLDNSLWDKNFITFSYLKEIETEEGRKKARIEANLFEEFPYEILAFPPDAFDVIQGKFYWEGEPKFTTYDEAFRFFAQVGELYENPECILSNALALFHNEEAMKVLLKKYLENSNIQYREYAERLLHKELSEKLKNRKLSILSDFIIVVKQGKEAIPIREETSGDVKYIEGLIEKLGQEFGDRDFLYLPKLKYEKMNDYLLLRELEQFSFITLLSYGNQTELFILDPRYWEIINRLEVNELEFINCQYYDNRKYEYQLEPYKEVANTNYESLFSEVKRHRYFEVLISSVRSIKDISMKTIYYGGERKLVFKKPAYEQIIENIISRIKHKEKVTKEKDDAQKKATEK